MNHQLRVNHQVKCYKHQSGIVPPISLEKLRNKYIQKERFNNP